MLTKLERDSLLPTCQKIYELAMDVRKTEISKMERNFKYNDPYMQLAVTLIFEGVDPEYVRVVLENCRDVSEAGERERVEKNIILEGVLLIQRGVPADLIYLLVLSYLGEDYCNDFLQRENSHVLFVNNETINQNNRMTQKEMDSILAKKLEY